MKNHKLGPLLLLLFLTATQRSSSIDPVIATTIASTTIKGVIDISKGLKEAIGWFEEKTTKSFKLDEAISKLETQIGELPIEVGAIHRKVLEGLYRSQSRVIRTRTLLEAIAHNLKTQTDGLINMYNRNEASSELFNYSVKRFVKLARNVKMQLKDAMNIYKETHDELVNSKITLESYNFKLEIQEQQHSVGHNEKIDGLETTFILVTVFTLGLGAPIAYPIIYGQIADLQDKLNELKVTIDHIQDTVGDLVNDNEDISKYVLKEINLIQVWESKLIKSISDHEEMTPEDIKFGIPMIKASLSDLSKACMNYINHKLPEALQYLTNEIQT